MKYSYNMSFEDIAKGAAACGARSQSVREDMHKMMVSVCVRWVQTGDVTVPVRYATMILQSADPYYQQSVIDWFGAFAGFEYHKATEAFTYTRTTLSEVEALAAKAKPFWQFSPAKALKPYDFNDALDKLISAAEKHAKKPKEGDVIDMAAVRVLRELRSIGGTAMMERLATASA